MAAALVMLAAARAACDSSPIGSAPATTIALRGTTIAIGSSNNIVRVCDLADSSCTFRTDVSSVNNSLGFGATVAIMADSTTLFVGAPAGNVIERHRYNGAGWTGAIIADGAGTNISEVGFKGLMAWFDERLNATLVLAFYKFTYNGTEYDRHVVKDGDGRNPHAWDVSPPSSSFNSEGGIPTTTVYKGLGLAQLFVNSNGDAYDYVVWRTVCAGPGGFCQYMLVNYHNVSAALSTDLAISDDESLLAIGVTDGTFRVVDSHDIDLSGIDGGVLNDLAESGVSTLEGRAPFALTAAFVAASTATGAVQVWQRNGTGWVEHATIDYNAHHIAIDGTTLLVANNNDVPRVYDLNACAASRKEPTDNTPAIAAVVAGVVMAALAAACLVHFR